ncbi:GDSL-type esterase/lipase family protein [Glutamicibacter mysorens]
MTGKARTRIFAVITAACAALALGGLAPAAAQADPAGSISYVNLGDSYSAGFGSGAIVPGPLPGCLQTTGPSHVSQIAALPGVDLSINAACAGFTAEQVGMAAAALAAPLSTADLVTLTLGGNDLPWRQAVAACSTQGSDSGCDQATAALAAAIGSVGPRVHRTLERIDLLSPATILVAGYPRLFTSSTGDQPLISATHARTLNRLGDELNREIRAATRGTSAKFVPVLGPFNNHGFGASESWIYFNPANPVDPFNLHPTGTGYSQGYFPALAHRIDLGELAG